KLQLGVGDDDAPLIGVVVALLKQAQAGVLQLLGQLLAQVLYQALVGDAVLIVALGGLGGGGEDGLFQLLGQLVIAGDNLAAEGLACLVGLPHGAEHVTPDNELVGQHFQLLHQHHTVFVFLFGKFLRHILGVGGNQVVFHN